MGKFGNQYNMRNSDNYIWNTSFLLGKGATGDVYQGIDQNTGEAVAVKVFNPSSHYRPWQVQMREFQVMKELSHKNVVMMIAEEEEVQNRKKVIIMELCIGGSLYNVLEEPQNSFGLEEEEFLCVLKDISAGMKYLRDKKIVHRDLKPGNILKYISEEGSVFKLSDFGAARYLDDGEKFESLHGTTEFLHPGLYERAYKQPAKVLSFGATVDLWSIGVTIYYIATCLLPFQAFHGKRDKNTMHKILFEKAPGVISGVQRIEDGPILWSNELPGTCLLSEGLKKLVTELLAGILEKDEKKVWSFNQYFEYVSDIISRKVFHVFHVDEGKELRLYMKPNKKLEDLKDEICAETGVPSSNQLLLFEKSIFASQIDSSLDVSTFPYTADQPLFLLHMQNTEEIKNLTGLGSLPAPFPIFPPMIRVKTDADLTKICCSIAHAIKRSVVKLVKYQKQLLMIPKILISLLEDNAGKLCLNSRVVNEKHEDVNYRTNLLESSFSLTSRFISALPDENDCKKESQKLSAIISEIKISQDKVKLKVEESASFVSLLKEKVFVSRKPQTQWEEALSKCSCLTGCVEKANTYAEKVHSSWQIFIKEQIGSCSEKLHILERVKIKNTCNKLLNLKDECLNSYLQASSNLIKWFRDTQAVIIDSCRLEHLAYIKRDLNCYSLSLKKAESEVYELNKEIVALLKSSKMPKELQNGMISKEDKSIKMLKQDNEDLSKILEKSDRICEKLASLVT